MANEEVEYEEPSEEQIQTQDEIDGNVQELFDSMRDIYSRSSGVEIPEVEHDIYKLTRVRELVEELLGLPDVY